MSNMTQWPIYDINFLTPQHFEIWKYQEQIGNIRRTSLSFFGKKEQDRIVEYLRRKLIKLIMRVIVWIFFLKKILVCQHNSQKRLDKTIEEAVWFLLRVEIIVILFTGVFCPWST